MFPFCFYRATLASCVSAFPAYSSAQASMLAPHSLKHFKCPHAYPPIISLSIQVFDWRTKPCPPQRHPNAAGHTSHHSLYSFLAHGPTQKRGCRRPCPAGYRQTPMGCLSACNLICLQYEMSATLGRIFDTKHRQPNMEHECNPCDAVAHMFTEKLLVLEPESVYIQTQQETSMMLVNNGPQRLGWKPSRPTDGHGTQHQPDQSSAKGRDYPPPPPSSSLFSFSVREEATHSLASQ